MNVNFKYMFEYFIVVFSTDITLYLIHTNNTFIKTLLIN